MNSAFPSSLNPVAARALAENFEEITFSDFCSGNDCEDKKLYLIYLHGKRSAEPLKYRQSTSARTIVPFKNKLQQTNYDRFFLLGDPKSNRVVALFSSNDKESRILTRYHTEIHPGKVVAIIEPRIKGTMIDSQNLLIATSEPFIPVPKTTCSPSFNELPPFDIENETDIKCFHFSTNQLSLKYIIPTVDLCAGEFCDGQASRETMCVCVEKSGVKEWGLRALVQCPELSLERTSHQKSSFTSVKFAKMMTLNHNTIRPQDACGFSLMEFRRSVRDIVDCINNLDEGEPTSNCPKGFQIIGWFKPSKLESESFLEVHEFHVVAIEPKVDPLPESVKQLKFPKPAPLV